MTATKLESEPAGQPSTFIQNTKVDICVAASKLQKQAVRWQDLHTIESTEEMVKACRSMGKFLAGVAEEIEGRFLR